MLDDVSKEETEDIWCEMERDVVLGMFEMNSPVATSVESSPTLILHIPDYFLHLDGVVLSTKVSGDGSELSHTQSGCSVSLMS